MSDLIFCNGCETREGCRSVQRCQLRPAASKPRSNQAQVRNPLLALPSATRIRCLPVEARLELGALLREISADARQRAEKCWRTHKAPMAAYWKAVAVYANHAARICR